MIKFTRYHSTQLFLNSESATEQDGFFAYFVAAPPAPELVDITINQSWADYAGFYLFLKSAPLEANLSQFAADITAYFSKYYPECTQTGFAWVPYDSITQSLGDITVVAGNLTEEKAVTVKDDVSFVFGSYSMPLKKTAPILPVKDAENNIISFTYEYPAYEGAPAPRQAFNIQVPLTGKKRGTLLGQVSIGDLSDNVATGWNASLYYVIKYNGTDIVQNYPLFETGGSAGLQILFDYQLDPADALNPDRSYLGFTGTSFFLQKNGEGNWYIQLNEQGSLPSYFRTVYGRKVSLTPLVNSDHPPRLVFEELPQVAGKQRFYFAPSGDFELSVTDNANADELVSDFLVCGLSGTESMGFVAKTAVCRGDVIRFVPKQNAYAPVFRQAAQFKESIQPAHVLAAKAREALARQLKVHIAEKLSGIKLQASSDGLTGKYKTSWINIRPNPLATDADLKIKRGAGATNQVPVYYSQPNDAALYDHKDIIADVADEVLQLRNTPAALFTAGVIQSLPMVPYGGVTPSAGFTFANIMDFEKQVIIPARRDVVSAIPLPPQTAGLLHSAADVLTTTPQGLLATVPDFGLNWKSVLLAKSQSKNKDYNLEFVNEITKELRDALQSNQLFLVATEADPLGDFLNKITIADWPFTINVGSGSDKGNFKNVLIFKFGNGSLEDRIKDTQTWTNAKTFNENPTLVSNWITSYIENTKLSAQTDTRYNNFLELVKNPQWNGILALRVDIGVENFPADLKGLLAGIKRDEFYAHHFGLEVNFIEPAGGVLTLPKSSLFGLINYVDKDYRAQQDIVEHLNSNPTVFSVQEVPSPVNNGQGLYDFKVLTLQVVFENSEIKDFASKIQLVATTWFDEPAQLASSNLGDSLNSQTIEFNGSYEKHNGVNTYTFVTRPNETYKFLLDSQTLNYVEIIKAQFFTITDDTNKNTGLTADTEEISSRFTFWGYMNFKLMDSFDLFSFGDTATQQNTSKHGLYFSNLNIDMDFTLDNVSGTATDRQFTFEPGGMSFDLSQSTPRDNSLFKNFPINLSGLMYPKNGTKSQPADLGYLPVGIRSEKPVGGQALGDKWYSLLYDLNLGSMGALAAKAGFVSQISTAWSPGKTANRLVTGIKLPGVGGQKTLSLQSVLSLNIQSFTFVAAKDAADETAYLLRFNNVKLNLLGKKLPAAADTQFVLFGDASGKDKTTLAWYTAYYAKPKKVELTPPDEPLTVKL
jgi:hypothetical protein